MTGDCELLDVGALSPNLGLLEERQVLLILDPLP